MADTRYTGLEVEVVRNEEQGAYQFGVRINGVFVVFAGRKLGGVDQDLANAVPKPPVPEPLEGDPGAPAPGPDETPAPSE